MNVFAALRDHGCHAGRARSADKWADPTMPTRRHMTALDIARQRAPWLAIFCIGLVVAADVVKGE